MYGKQLASAAFALAIVYSGAANAANVTSIRPESIVQALQNNGYKAKLEKTSDGEPIITTGVDGNNIVIVMTDCTKGKNCTTTEFVGIWDCSGSVEKCRKAATEFNNQESPVHVLLSDDGKTATTYSYLLFDEVGISEELYIKNLTTFSHYNSQFSVAVSEK